MLANVCAMYVCVARLPESLLCFVGLMKTGGAVNGACHAGRHLPTHATVGSCAFLVVEPKWPVHRVSFNDMGIARPIEHLTWPVSNNMAHQLPGIWAFYSACTLFVDRLM